MKKAPVRKHQGLFAGVRSAGCLFLREVIRPESGRKAIPSQVLWYQLRYCGIGSGTVAVLPPQPIGWRVPCTPRGVFPAG